MCENKSYGLDEESMNRFAYICLAFAINRSTIAALCSSVLVEPTERSIPCWRAKALARLIEVSEALIANDSASLFFV